MYCKIRFIFKKKVLNLLTKNFIRIVSIIRTFFQCLRPALVVVLILYIEILSNVRYLKSPHLPTDMDSNPTQPPNNEEITQSSLQHPNNVFHFG